MKHFLNYMVLALTVVSSVSFGQSNIETLTAKQDIIIKPKTTFTMVLDVSQSQPETSANLSGYCVIRHSSEEYSRRIEKGARFNIVNAKVANLRHPNLQDVKEQVAYWAGVNVSDDIKSLRKLTPILEKQYGITITDNLVPPANFFSLESVKTDSVYQLKCQLDPLTIDKQTVLNFLSTNGSLTFIPKDL